MKIADIPKLKEAPISSKLELIDELWADVTAKSDTLPLPDWHAREIDQSLADYKVNPREGRPWSEIRDGLLGDK
jgi:hypothetical protein